MRQSQNKNQSQGKKQSRQIWYLPNADILEEVPTKRFVISAIATICLILVALIVWAGFTTIQETALAEGEIVPTGQIQVIQHLEGGVIVKKFVKNGDEVKKGQKLVQLDVTTAQSELRQMEARQIALQIDAARLRSFTTGGDDSLLTWKEQLHKSGQKLDAEQMASVEKMLSEDKSLLKLQHLARDDKRAVITAQIEQRKREIDKLTQQRVLVARNLTLYRKELAMHERLVRSKYISEREYLRVQRETNKANRELIQVTEQIKQAKDALVESNSNMRELNSSMKEKSSALLGEINAELLQVRYRLKKLMDRMTRTVIFAPMSGFVKGFDLNLGSVIPEGGVVMSLVPTGVSLQAHVRITTRDIGHVNVGDRVRIKVNTYDFSRYGVVMGTLDAISATTFTDPEKGTYYRGVVALDKSYVAKKQFRLRSGMTVSADIITGDNTILRFVLKPIDVTIRQGFSER